jgi:hypothetical protein
MAQPGGPVTLNGRRANLLTLGLSVFVLRWTWTRRDDLLAS